ncbi:MAG TPA: F0F1 ATP synthase subunit epsilon [Candidatus Paceibacterota bacterium]|nr:F0F1 ATP synthase subunit epsilon [Candidatus Paceibacterota bacterium]
MARAFHLTIAKVGETLFDGPIQSVTLPGKEGVFTVLAGHEPFVSELGEGEAIVVGETGEKATFPLSGGGIAEVSSGQATVLL